MTNTRRLESLRTQWERTGSVRDHGEYLRALIDEGLLPEASVSAAAGLGHPGALASGVGAMPFSVDYQEQVEEAVCLMDQRAAVSFASDCIERALFAWEVIRPRDVRPRVAARATVQWLRGAADTETIAQAGEAASNAAAEADYPELVEDTNPELARAIHAANAASHAALAAECAARGDDEDLPNAVACAADLAARAANDPQAERAWQIARLTQLLLTHDRSGYFKP